MEQYSTKKWGAGVFTDRGTSTASSHNSRLYYIIVK
jgi:hypothetical protein